MGRYSFAAQRVHQHATQLLERSRLAAPPPWYSAIGTTPPASRLTRPPLQKPSRKGKKAASRMFQPLPLKYGEDHLRWEYFNDHPWELARPRVVLENDGRDMEKWDWGVELDISLNRPQQGETRDDYGRTLEMWERIWSTQCARPINGESVIQRQQWLIANRGVSQAVAYDIARKEFYRIRHFREIEQRVAREEALAVGAEFGPGPLEIGMHLEDKQYEEWKLWAAEQTARMKQLEMGGASGGINVEEENPEPSPGQPDAVSDSIPASRDGLTAEGQAEIRR